MNTRRHNNAPKPIKNNANQNNAIDSQSKRKETNSKLKAKWTNMANPTSLLSTITVGVVFGFTLNKGRVFEPQVIIDQFLFKRWIMMKMFLSVAATSILSMALLKCIAPKQYSIARASKAKYNLKTSIIGGVLLGVGMAVSGACPGMVLISIGAGVTNSFITLIGGVVGALLYGLIEPWLRASLKDKSISIAFMDDIGNTYVLSIVFSVMMFGVVYVLENIFPWKSELTTPIQKDCHWIQCKAWSPILSGIIVGLIQIPAVMMLGVTIGCSSSYVCVVSQWLRVLSESKQKFFKALKGKLNSFWQVVYVCCAIFGSMIAVECSGEMSAWDLQRRTFDGIKGNNREKAFIGGFLMIFGARMAEGCTSGHGLSGVGMLSVASMIAVAAMFIGGGIVAAII